jgi:hypothetical protein
VKPIADEMARDCMGVRMRMANRVVTAIYDEALTDLGLKGTSSVDWSWCLGRNAFGRRISLL